MQKEFLNTSAINSNIDTISTILFLLIAMSFGQNTLADDASQNSYSEITRTEANAIFLTHGWNSSVRSWPVEMAQSFCDRLDVSYSSDNAASNDFTLICSGNNWDVWVIDWRSQANTGFFNPAGAFNNAAGAGEEVSRRLVSLNYSHLHLVAHSAGANLISSVAKNLKSAAEIQPDREIPFIHATFLDAYDPDAILFDNDIRSFSRLGEDADAIDNYIDARVLGANFEGLDKTLNIINGATNIEVQDADTSEPLFPDFNYPSISAYLNDQVNRLHDWPHIFYRRSIENSGYQVGYPLSLEAGSLSPLLNNTTTLCIIENVTDNCVSESNMTTLLVATSEDQSVDEVTESEAAAPDLTNTSVTGTGLENDAGYVFSRTDVEELRWVAANGDAATGSVWIDQACAESLGGPTVFGDWFELTAVAPAQDTVTNPCSNPVATADIPVGYVFSRSDVNELRWITTTDEGVNGSIWIDQSCADSLGGPTAFGSWFELTDQAPAQDSVDPPCG